MVSELAGVINLHAPITLNFPFGSNREIAGDYVQT
jgi:hypothetical protein